MLEDCSPLWVSAYFSYAHSSSMAIKCELLALRGVVGQIGSILWLLCWWTLTGESLVLFFKILSGFIMLWLRDIFLSLTLKSWNTIYLLFSDICVEHPCWVISMSAETMTTTANCKVRYSRDLCFVKVSWWAVWSLIPCGRGDSRRLLSIFSDRTC